MDFNQILTGVGKQIGYALPGLNGLTSFADKYALGSRALGSEDLIPGFDPFTQRSSAIPTSSPTTSTQSGPYEGGSVQGASTGGVGYAQPAGPDTAAVSYWDDQIGSLQRLLGSTNTQKDQGLQGLTDSYNRTVGDLTEAQTRATRDYGIKREETQADRQSALRRIDSGARNGYNGLQRLFQLAGSAGGSAAKMVAPDAVARDASMKRSGTLDTFGRNSRAIDISEADANSQFARNRRDIDSQKRQKEQSFIEGILNLQNDLNARLGNAVTQRGIAQGGSYGDLAGARAQYDTAIRSNQSTLDNLFNQYRDPQFTSQAINLQAPALSQYTVDGTRIDAAAQNPDVPEELLPYLAALKDDERQGGNIYV